MHHRFHQSKYALLVLGMSLIIASCSSSKKHPFAPPQAAFSEDHSPLYALNMDYQGERDDKIAAQWWSHYSEAMQMKAKTPDKACPHFLALAEEKDFPLSDIAYLRAYETCDEKKNQIEFSFELNEFKKSPWLKELALEISIKKLQGSQQKRKLMEALVTKSKYSIIPSEKTQLMLSAIELARSIKDKKKIAQYRERLYRIAPRYHPNPPHNKLLETARDFRRHRHFKKAVTLYNRIISHSSFSLKTKYSALRGLRHTYKLQHKKALFLKTTHRLAIYTNKLFRLNRHNPQITKMYHDANLTLARTLWTKGQVTKAKKVLKALAKYLYKKYPLDMVYWVRGRMSEERKKHHQALRWYFLAKKELKKNSPLHERIDWYRAWSFRKVGNHKRASQLLSYWTQKTEDPFSEYRYRFWNAKNLKDLGQPDKARNEFLKLTERDPIGYYGLVSYRELNLSIPTFEQKRGIASVPPSDSLDRVIPKEKVIYLDWLSAVKENNVLVKYLNHLGRTLRKDKVKDDVIWLSLFHYYAQAGRYLPLFEQLGLIESNQRQSLIEKNPELIFPRPYKDTVGDIADQFKVSSEIIYSIMRQESAFNPFARSPADAYGLMQLLPRTAKSTAKKTAKDLKIEIKKTTDLYHPETNISLGAAHLRDLWDQYDGQFILMVASYNASGRAIKNWMKTRYNGNSLEFIEDIPYEETRGYIKLVLRNLIFYSRLNSDDSSISFPEWCLKFKQYTNS